MKSRGTALSLMAIILSDADLCRFWVKVDQTGGLNACWHWTGARNKQTGYGRFNIRGNIYQAHRVALWIARREEGQETRHSCDNPPCCNPAHLKAGTHVENKADNVTRGRQTRCFGEANGLWRHPESVRRGAAHGSAKLTELQRAEIKRRFVPFRKRGDGAASFLAREFGVSRSQVRRVGNEQRRKEGV